MPSHDEMAKWRREMRQLDPPPLVRRTVILTYTVSGANMAGLTDETIKLVLSKLSGVAEVEMLDGPYEP